MLTALVDYDSGNLHSAEKAFQRVAAELGAGEVIVTSNPDDIARADRIVLPGDGAFAACRAALTRDHAALYEAIVEAATQKARPFLGICIGMQMMASTSYEHQKTDGFDWIPGEIVKITPTQPSLKVPHMGWNDLVIENDHPILVGVTKGQHAYFVHSYRYKVTNPHHRLAYVEYGNAEAGDDITAVIVKDTMVGMQFHPEKSQNTGLKLISNFLTWAP